jgi:diguanylate cyclase (GGDEF)-like protein/PAS domain S-box-containing protein
MSKRTFPPNRSRLRHECGRLRTRLEQVEETLHAIQSGQVDAIMGSPELGSHVLAIEGMDSAYRTLVEGMNEGIVTFGVDYVILFSNRRFAQILNMPPTRIAASFFQDWVASTDLPRFAALIQGVPSGNRRIEITLTSGGALIPVQLSINAVRLDGRDAYTCMVTDLTEQKLAQLVLEQATESIVVCDDSGCIIRASQTACALFEDESAVLGQPFASVFPLRLADGARADITPALRGERLQFEAAIERGGQSVHFVVNAGPLAGQHKNLLGCIVTLTDITARKNAQQALLVSVDRYRSLVLATTQIVWTADADGGVSEDNPSWCAYTGQSEDQIKGNGWINALHPDDVPAALAQWSAAVAAGALYTTQFRVRRHDGAYRYHVMRGVPVLAQDGAVREWVGTATDIHEQQQAELRMVQEHGVLLLRERALEASTEAVFIARCGADGNLIEYVNPAFEKITGYPASQVLGMDLLALEQKLCPDGDLSDIDGALHEQRAGHAITQNYRLDGTSFWSDLHIAPVHGSEAERVTHFVGIQNDVSQSMRYQNALEYQANHDALTGLPNRNLLNDRLRRAISSAQRHEDLMALVFVDLDHFKFINDNLGHDVGDIVLKAIADRLASCLRDADTAARPGGDEFLLILVEQESTESISAVIRRILEVIALPIPINGRDLHITCSIGISIYLQDGDDVSTLLKNADTAMYHAKERGRNNFQFFNHAMNQRVHERFMLESSLRHAIADDNLTLLYQPQIDINSGRMIGMEALLRWHHPELGLIEPARFIPIAEESGLIMVIGEWVLRTACAQNKAWQDAGLPPVNMAVNLSARQFRHDKLAEMVGAVLAETGLAAQYLELELTESLALEDSQKFMLTLKQLKQLGLQLAIDDFGTGYSSLSYLKHFPLDRLKIDISFVRSIVSDAGDAAIARIIIMLGHSLHLKVIAEGVESEDQLDFLREQGCDEMQGFLYSEPLTAAALECLLRNAGNGDGRLLEG